MNARMSCSMQEGWAETLEPVFIEAFCEELNAQVEAIVAAGQRMTMSQTIDRSACLDGRRPPGLDLWREQNR